MNLQSGRALAGEMPLDPPVLSTMCWNSNPVTQAPETDKIVQGLLREDLFMASAEHFLSDTASYADILLPAAMGAEMGAEMEDKQKGQGEQFVMISPHDAGARDIVDGDRVQVGNGRDAFKGMARVTDDVKPGIVVATLGAWRQLNEGMVNSISSAAFTDMGHAPSFSDNPVEVAQANRGRR